MNFHRIEHINKACQNLATTLQFYQTLFPDWFIRAQETSDEFSWVHFGDRQFYVSLYERLNPSQSIPLNTGNIDHAGFVIADGEKMMALLDANKIEYFVLADDDPETKYRIYVSDPDGTYLELVEYHKTYEFR